MNSPERSAMTVAVIGRGRFARTLITHLLDRLDDRVQIVQCYRETQMFQPHIPLSRSHRVHQAPVHTLLGEKGMEQLHAFMTSYKPDVVVCAASCYSPYGTGSVEGTPFGATLPFQLPIALNVAKAAHAIDNHSLLLNACYPELVNPVARLLDIPFDAGLGNAQTLNWDQRFGTGKERLFALAHHSHLGSGYRHEPLMYDSTQGRLREPEAHHTQMLDDRRRLSRGERNDIGAMAAASLLAQLSTSPSVTACLPGVKGETGAMPVSLGLNWQAKPRIELDVADLNRVRAQHQQECLAEGWDICQEALELTPTAHKGMGVLSPPSLRVEKQDLKIWVDLIGRSL
ncbi:hypothetical protein AB3464_04990 [Pseudomonas asplenii]|uniref:hypothetical protein n=1 Tax=Pseudomonas asplenii TaxID=53407 RepID=UPI0037CB8808